MYDNASRATQSKRIVSFITPDLPDVPDSIKRGIVEEGTDQIAGLWSADRTRPTASHTLISPEISGATVEKGAVSGANLARKTGATATQFETT